MTSRGFQHPRRPIPPALAAEMRADFRHGLWIVPAALLLLFGAMLVLPA